MRDRDGRECGRGYISRELRVFLEKFVELFGRPTEPITLRTAEVRKPGRRAVAAETEPKPRRKPKVKMNDLFPSKYLRSADLSGPRIVTIDHVTHDAFRDDGVNVTKTVLHFKGNGIAPMVCNKTSWRMLVALTGADDDENWTGHTVKLVVEKVNAPGGKIVDSLSAYAAAKPAVFRPRRARAGPGPAQRVWWVCTGPSLRKIRPKVQNAALVRARRSDWNSGKSTDDAPTELQWPLRRRRGAADLRAHR
jgi:hypothetical protein